jgi:tetratricopeptide (TPR) repeat protein
MGILIGLIKQIRTWETSAKIALAVNLSLLLLAVFILFTNETLRTPALIGAAGLLVALQGIVLWGNRNMVAPYTQAQRYYLVGEFERARDILRADMDELAANGKNPTIDSLVLLGNSYRNLGQLRESESILRIAVARRPDYHFAQYGLAKTRQAVGDYNAAISYLSEALKQGAPAIIRFDLAFTQYLRGDDGAARAVLNSIPETDEIHRMLMTTYLHHVLAQGLFPDAELIEAGLLFWEAEIERFGHMPYGRDLQVIIQRLQAQL